MIKERAQKWVRSKKCYAYLTVGTLLAFSLGGWIGSKILLPVLMTVVIYPVYALDLWKGKRTLAVLHTLFWAFVSSVFMILFVRYDETRMAKVVFKGIDYRDEMFQWILTGAGAEGNIKLFLPQHFKHFLIFCVSSFVTAGVWGLAFGAILLNYMNFYVASLSLHAHHPLIIYLFGWPVWALFRVVGFVLCGVALSEPLLSQLLRFRSDTKKCYQFFFWGLAFILADILLKVNLAPPWREMLRHAVSL